MKDGMTLLDLGCGWGSVALYFAEKFKKSRSAFVIKNITFFGSF
jgi:cyclopropane fatty-acyl-phospholipid synthase-like methyltransferase